LVDAERLEARLLRLERLLELLDATRASGVDAYLRDEERRAATERRLQLAIQVCIDVGAQLVSELSARPPSDYADVFLSLAETGMIDRSLAERLGRAAGQRNLLVHAYLDIDDRQVFESLSRLEDLRAFAAVAQRRAAAG